MTDTFSWPKNFRIVGGQNVLLDRDAATHFGVSLKTLRASVSRNQDRFPKDSVIVLNRKEARSLGWKRGALPQAFTELGVVALAFVLRSPNAVQGSIAIIRTLSRHGALRLFTGAPNVL